MALYNRGNLDPNDSIASPGFRRASFLHAQADLDPARKQAQQELQDELGSRGLARGGQGIAARLAERNGYVQQLGQVEQKLGVEQANAGEANRQTQEGRGWQTEDQRLQSNLEDELRKMGYTAEDDNARAAFAGQMFNGIGKIGGSVAGNYYANQQGRVTAPASMQSGGSTYGQLFDRGQGEAPVVRY